MEPFLPPPPTPHPVSRIYTLIVVSPSAHLPLLDHPIEAGASHRSRARLASRQLRGRGPSGIPLFLLPLLAARRMNQPPGFRVCREASVVLGLGLGSTTTHARLSSEGWAILSQVTACTVKYVGTGDYTGPTPPHGQLRASPLLSSFRRTGHGDGQPQGDDHR